MAQEMDSKKIESSRFKRLYQMNDSIYRSEQPNKKGFKELEAMGVKSVISFRRVKDDRKKAKGTGIKIQRIPLRSKELTEEQIIEALRMISDAPKPVLIHCFHGSDRTGVISAAYRVVFEDWSKDKAIDEMRYEDFGYHEKWYPFLVDMIQDLDVEKIRTELGLD
jgi:tyrosine-protein phosphatase SIW14